MNERDIRIGDAEREHALELLGKHLGEGRLSVDEYGERSARVTTAKTRGDLYALFGDLPAPRPKFTQLEPVRPSTVQRGRRIDGSVVMVVALACVGLFFAMKTPLVFLLIPVAMLLVNRLGNR